MGHEVVGVDALTDYYSRALKEINLVDVVTSGALVHLCDLAVDDLNHIMKGFDVVFHFAAQLGISAGTSFENYVHNNITA